jgi:hypothetical protein
METTKLGGNIDFASDELSSLLRLLQLLTEEQQSTREALYSQPG